MSVDLGTLRVVVADDHAMVRRGLCLLLAAEPDAEVVGQTGTLAEAEALVAATHPDVLVLDLMMGTESTLPAVPRLAASTNVVMLTMHDSPAYAREALSAGARAYVLKDAADDELKHAVRAVAAGQTYLSPTLGAQLVMADHAGGEELTAREVDVLRLIGLGHTNTEIADLLEISTRTVESHRAHIQQKLSCDTRADLVRHALRLGLLDR